MNHPIPRAWILGISALVAPTALLAASVALTLPADLRFASKDTPAPVLFRHATHVDAERPGCRGCHPEPFRMLHPLRHTSHAQMDAGRSCGICHDGKRSFATSDGERCDRCHSPQAGS
jgi:c(7)-type cytochrome triheme protein